MRRNGAQRVAFDFIVVSGANSSLPHGIPSDKPIQNGDFVTLDFGAVVDGYHSDMTRTVAVGSVSDEQKMIYDTVLKAQLASLATLKAGVPCLKGDAAARDIIVAAGYGEQFGHGTGHGVGVQIHEGPNLSPRAGVRLLKAGNIVTVEPGIYLEGKPRPGVGPHDIALAIIGAVFKKGYVKNKVMEFVGPGIASMDTDFRNGVDVMTTETTCLSSIWQTDEDTKAFLALHGRGEEYRELKPAEVTYYDGMVYVNLSEIKPMIALPFHPSNVYTIDELNANLGDILRSVEVEAQKLSGDKACFTLTDKIENGKLKVQQGIVAGCAGGNYSNVMAAAHILKNASCGSDAFTMSVYPSSQPVFMDLLKKGAISDLMAAGVTVKTAFCGPCFGAGDTPANNALSIRHTTRNFPNREGSKPGAGQMSAVALMDARSIAATGANGGYLTSAEQYADDYAIPAYDFDASAYQSRVYQGFGKAEVEKDLVYGPNIKDWPQMSALTDNILLKVCSKIMDDVTTTDELIPSGETSSYRSNPLGLAEFTLSRRDPQYVGRAKEVDVIEKARRAGEIPCEVEPALKDIFAKIQTIDGCAEVKCTETEIGSMVYAMRPGDGSAREQAASCQRVLGGLANICLEYATKRYRSNVMNWGMIPFQMKGEPEFEVGDYIFVPGIREILDGDMKDIKAYVIGDEVKEISLYIADMTAEERTIVKAGSLINYNQQKQ
ncbi:MAG: hydratase, partial [Clostridia bacterium]|nr:hydratase [Clostridia bacterium]